MYFDTLFDINAFRHQHQHDLQYMFSSLTNIKTLPLFRIRRVASTVACAWYIMFECRRSCFDYNAMNDIVTTSFFIVTACKLKNSAQLNVYSRFTFKSDTHLRRT